MFDTRNPAQWKRANPLPSNGMLYETDVLYRGYTLGELLVVGTSDLSIQQKVEIMAQGMIRNDGKDVYDLTFYDFAYVGLLRKLGTLGDMATYTMALECDVCREKMTRSLRGDHFAFSDLETKFPFKEKLGSTTTTVSPITVRRYLDILPETDFHILAASMGMSFEQLLTSEHITEIAHIEQLLCHTLEPIDFKCDYCGNKRSVALELLSNRPECSLVLPELNQAAAKSLSESLYGMSKHFSTTPNEFYPMQFSDYRNMERLAAKALEASRQKK